ncbi:hypothetical protein ACKWTF_006268 [Chironomus riparius]
MEVISASCNFSNVFLSDPDVVFESIFITFMFCFVFDVVLSTCSVKLSFMSKVTPRKVNLFTHFRVCLSTVNLGSTRFFLCLVEKKQKAFPFIKTTKSSA